MYVLFSKYTTVFFIPWLFNEIWFFCKFLWWNLMGVFLHSFDGTLISFHDFLSKCMVFFFCDPLTKIVFYLLSSDTIHIFSKTLWWNLHFSYNPLTKFTFFLQPFDKICFFYIPLTKFVSFLQSSDRIHIFFMIW